MRVAQRFSILFFVPLFVPFLVLPLSAARAQLAPRDSLRILDKARSAQFSFETDRRLNLPRLQPSTDHQCDVVIGRMCYWNEDEDSDTTVVPEPASISRARHKLIRTLERLSALSPADSWIAGQRVRYLVEGGDDSAAVTAARECRAARWWCGVMMGYALHSSGDYEAAEAIFDIALAAMPHDVRCKWTDISLLLQDKELDDYQRLPCDARGEIEQRFWKMAQPSYMVHGNDRRTEHFSRVFLAELSASSTNTYGMLWGDDMREILIRYGPPVWYASSWPTGFGATAATTGHDRPHSYHFVASIDGDSTHWDVRSKNAHERYAPPYIDSLADLPAQFAMVKRGDSAIVVVIYADSLSPASAVLGLGGDSGSSMVTGDSASATSPYDASHTHVRRARTAWKGVVAGVEEYDPAKRMDARARSWIAPPASPPGAPELSTLLFFAGDTSKTASSLDEALARALTADQLGGDRKLGLYWEMYGTGVDHGVAGPRTGDSTTTEPEQQGQQGQQGQQVSITVTRTDGGVLKWLAQTLRITPKDSPFAMQWHETPLGNDVTARSVVLDLAQLPKGMYRITLAAGPDDGHRTVTSREIRLR